MSVKNMNKIFYCTLMKRITLKNETWGKNEQHRLEAYINNAGDLVLEGYEAGDSVKKHYDDFDFEYWYTIDIKDVHTVLLELIKDRFDNANDYLEWLKEKKI
ncbi:MAG: hypothetical protein GPJ50_10280, partial [Candidatus Heimdallarchaeota archaeon]|nr:hypothetical protein [Candidatus Heimdallarchaeota archaeon]